MYHAVSAYLAKQKKINWIATKSKVEKIISNENWIFQKVRKKENRCNLRSQSDVLKEIKQNWWVWFSFRHIECDHWLGLALARRLSLFKVYRLSHKSLANGWIWMQPNCTLCTNKRTSKHTHSHTQCASADNEHSITNAFYMNGPVIVLLVMHSFHVLVSAYIQMISAMRIIRAIEIEIKIEMIKSTYRRIVEQPNGVRARAKQYLQPRHNVNIMHVLTVLHIDFPFFFSHSLDIIWFAFTNQSIIFVVIVVVVFEKRPPIFLTAINTMVLRQ